MAGGKQTRLLHLGEMEKLDKTLFRLEQGRSECRDRVRRTWPGPRHRLWMVVERRAHPEVEGFWGCVMGVVGLGLGGGLF